MTAKPKFKMPFVEPGMFVQWVPEPGHKGIGTASLVTEVGAEGISVLAFPPNTSGGRAISGIRHQDDPAMESEWIARPGCWRHMRVTEVMLDLMHETGPLRAA